MARLLVFTLLALAAVAPTASAQDNPWLNRGVLHMAHQGGEEEAPSNTFYAYKEAIRHEADMLELDVNITKDGELIAYHDTAVDGRTNGTGRVNALTYDYIATLDPCANSAWEAFCGGVVYGTKSPPAGYTAEDFRIRTLDDVLEAFPSMLINIEIKGEMPDNGSPHVFGQQVAAGNPTALDAAVKLAEVLDRHGRTVQGDHRTMVVSFSDAATRRFKLEAPFVDTAPGLAGTAAFYATHPAGGAPLTAAGYLALQPPTVFQGVYVPTPEFVKAAHANNLAVHVWLTDEETSDGAKTTAQETYCELIAAGVDGIMTDRPSWLQETLQAGC